MTNQGSSFSVGDHVKHMSGNEGFVTRVDEAGVHVDFGRPGLRGIYDANWFKIYPRGLEVVTPSLRQGDRG